jgi:intracellular proteinase inhibitor BsuPI
MRLRYVLPFLIACALAFAYASPSPSHSYEPIRHHAAVHDTIVSSLDVKVGDEVRFSFHVLNSSAKRVELRFPSGQTHDLVVLDPQGREVWRWSHGRMFTQSMQNKLLGASDTLTFNETWRPERPGSYTAVASLLSQNHPLEQRVEFSLPGKAISLR